MLRKALSVLLALLLLCSVLPLGAFAADGEMPPAGESAAGGDIPEEASEPGEEEERSPGEDEPEEVQEPGEGKSEKVQEPGEDEPEEASESVEAPSEEGADMQDELTEELLLFAASVPLVSGSFLYTVSADETVTVTGHTDEPLPETLNIPAEIDGKSVTAIAENAFADCASLRRVRFPASLRSIGARAFYNCASLLNAEFAGAPPAMGRQVFAGTELNFAVWVTGDTAGWPFASFDPSTQKRRINYWRPASGDSYACYEKNGQGMSAHLAFTAENSGYFCYEKDVPVDYSDELFLGGNGSVSFALADASLCLSLCANSDPAYFTYGISTGNRSDRYIRQALETAGFENDYYQYRFGDSDSSGDEAAYAVAWKLMPDGVPLVAVAIRGFSYGGEWVSNANVVNDAAPDYSYGFYRAAQVILNGGGEYYRDRWSDESANLPLADYLALHGIESENARFWVVGYSRGAGVANALGGLLNADSRFSNDRLFVYTFACPLTVRESAASPCTGVYNIVSEMDPVARIPLASWGYTRFGTSYYLPCRSICGDGFDARLAAMKSSFSALTSSFGAPDIQYKVFDGQELVLDEVCELLTALIPTAGDYDGTVQDTLKDFLYSYQVGGDAPDLSVLAAYIFRSEELCGAVRGVAEELSALSEGRLPDEARFRAATDRLVSLVTHKETLWGIPAVRLENAIAQYCQRLYSDAARVHSAKEITKLTESGEYKLILVLLDFLDCMEQDLTNNSALFMQHWPETYLAWLRSGTAADTLYSVSYSHAQCPPPSVSSVVVSISSLITDAVKKAESTVETIREVRIARAAETAKKITCAVFSLFRR